MLVSERCRKFCPSNHQFSRFGCCTEVHVGEAFQNVTQQEFLRASYWNLTLSSEMNHLEKIILKCELAPRVFQEFPLAPSVEGSDNTILSELLPVCHLFTVQYVSGVWLWCVGVWQMEQLRSELLQERASKQDLECDKIALDRQVNMKSPFHATEHSISQGITESPVRFTWALYES